MKRLFLTNLAIAIVIISLYGQQSFTITGTLQDEASGEPVAFANIALFTDNGSLITGVASDGEGKFVINNISSGTYKLEAQFVGYEKKVINNVLVKQSVKPGPILHEQGFYRAE